MSDVKECFVVSPIGEAGSSIRERSDKLLRYVIYPAVEPHGYEPIRADDIAEPGIITSQVIEKVVESPLVIADLSGSNANVFYELAVRHAIQEPIIQLISSDEDIPFDVAGTRTIQINLSDIESVENAKAEIGSQIENLEANDRSVETPISIALNLRNLRQSEDPEERSMAEIMEGISELRTNLVTVQNMLNNPEELLPPTYIRELSREVNIGDKKEVKERLNSLQFGVSEVSDYIDESDALKPPQRKEVNRILVKMRHDLRELEQVTTSATQERIPPVDAWNDIRRDEQ